MHTLRKTISFACALLGGACGSSTVSQTLPGTTQNVEFEIDADITQDTVWHAGTTLRLKRHIFVENATLSIEPGVTILGAQGSSLVVTSTGLLDAQGTAEAPIVFTSDVVPGQRAPGDWGGVVMLGRAPINVSGGSTKMEGFADSETRTVYGGNDAIHNCGTLRYARIEFAGFELAPDNELNGLTLGACGSDTVIDYVQVHRGADDGVEVFGGTVDLKHLLVTQTDDDGLDWDFGWRGRGQFIIVQQNAVVGNCGFEADNNKNNNDATPRSAPVIFNATLVGSGVDPEQAGKQQVGMLLRRGTAGQFGNVIVAHFADFPVDVDGSVTAGLFPNSLRFDNSLFYHNGHQSDWAEAVDNDGAFDEGAAFASISTNIFNTDPQLTDALNLTAPNFAPSEGSVALDVEHAKMPAEDNFFDHEALFLGAIGNDDWTLGWTAYPRD